MKIYNSELKFSAVKIKKIIQGNKEIGKIAHMTPYVICKKKNLILYSKIIRISCSRFIRKNCSNVKRKWNLKIAII